MEKLHRRTQSTLPTARSSTAGKRPKLKVNFLDPKPQMKCIETSRTRPMTAMSKKTIGSRKHLKTQSNRNSIESIEFDIIQKITKTKEVEEIYFTKKLALADNSFIFDQDAFKLQKLITGGYCCDDEFMSLSKFNQAKDNFILLKQIYDKAKKHQSSNNYQKEPLKSRNIYSVMYLNQNLKMMGHMDTQQIFQRLKIVR